MPRIERTLYHRAMERILQKVGYSYANLTIGKILITKKSRKLYTEIAGKNLPYLGSNGKEAFPWESHIRPARLDKIEIEAKQYGAECWIAFCYSILNPEYKRHFSTTVTLDKKEFGAKLIKATDYRSRMRPRSPSWSVVDLPRGIVTQITRDIENI